VILLSLHCRFLISQEPNQPGAVASLDDRGTFAISLNGRPIGAEKFTIRAAPSGIEATGDIQLKVPRQGGNTSLKCTTQLLLNSRLEPQNYSAGQSGSPDITVAVDFRQSPAASKLRVSGQPDDERTFALPKDVVILDDNVIHQYQLLLDRFAMEPDKRQTFAAYIPQEATPGTVILERVGNEEISLPGGKRVLTHFVMTAELARVELWADEQNHLQRFYNPSQNIEAVRKK